jgi:hypothetical protein
LLAHLVGPLLVAGLDTGGAIEVVPVCATAATAAVCPLAVPPYRPFSLIVSVGVRLARGGAYIPVCLADEGVRMDMLLLL